MIKTFWRYYAGRSSSGKLNWPQYTTSEMAAKRCAAQFETEVVEQVDLDVEGLLANRHITDYALLKDGQLISLHCPIPDNFLDEKAAEVAEWRASIGSFLSNDASALIEAWRGSDSGFSGLHLTGQLLTLAKIAKEVGRKFYLQPLKEDNGFQTEQVEEIQYQMADGTLKTFYCFSAGYGEDYQFEIFEERDELKDFLKRNIKVYWELVECLECGAEYEQAGNVAPGGFSCQQCA